MAMLASRLCLALGAALLVVATVAPTAVASTPVSAPQVAPAPPYTAFILDGDPTSAIGFGRQLNFDAGNSTITGSGSPTSVHLRVTTPDHNFDASFSPRQGQVLAVGDYPDAVQTGDATATQPGFDISGDGVGCNPSGHYTIEQIAFDALGNLIQFAADAEMHCGNPADLFAVLRLSSTVGYTALALPPPYVSDTGTLPFATTLVAQTSPVVQLTATNAGVQPLAISALITGVYGPDFQVAASTCAGLSPLAPGTSCTISITFTPHALGDRSASLVITDGTPRGHHDVTLDGTGTTPPTFTYPVAGQANVATTAPFTWTTSPGAQAYRLIVGSHAGAADLVDSGVLAATTASYPVPALTTGPPLYATILAETNNQWSLSQAITFTAMAQVAPFAYPVPGTANNDPDVPFVWNTNSQAGGYYLIVGTSPGAADLVNSGVLPATQGDFPSPAPLPSDVTLYATVFTEWAGSWNQSQSMAFAYESQQATFTSPLSGHRVTDFSAPFTWSPGQRANAYYLTVGTVPQGANLVNSGVVPNSQTWYHGVRLPKGVRLYATIYTQIGGSWNYQQAITFNAGS